MGTNSGGDLLLRLDRGAPRPLRAQLEEELRGAIRDGRLAADSRLPPIALAGRRPRRLATAGGGLLRPAAGRGLPDGAGGSRDVRRRGRAQRRRRARLGARRGRCATTSSPAAPTSPASRRRAWLRAQRAVLREAPDSALGYPDPRGALELRRALAGHLRRVRGVVADESTVLVCSGAAQAIALLAGVLGSGPEVAVEDPGLPLHREILAAAGASLAGAAARRGRGACGGARAALPGRRARHPRPPVADRGRRCRRAGGRACWRGRARARRS